MAGHNNTDEFNMDESSAFSNYARNAKSVVKTSEAVTESSDKASKMAASANAAKGVMDAASAGVTAVANGFGKIATAFGVPKQVVAFFMAIVTLFTSVAVAAPDNNSTYTPQVEAFCGGGPEVNEQMVAKEPVSQEERVLRAAKIYRYFHALDFTDEASAGIIANIMADSDGNANAYEGDDINLDFELVSMHHDNWDAYTKNLFTVYTSGTPESEGYPSHEVEQLFGGGKLNAGSLVTDIVSDTGSGIIKVDSVYKTNSDLYSGNKALFESEHKNSVNGRYLPGFGLFQWAGTRANDMLYYANSLHLAQDVDDDMNNDYVYEVPFQIAYLLYEDKADVYNWAKTSYRTDYNISFMRQFLTYDKDNREATYTEKTEPAYTEKTEPKFDGRTVTLTHYNPAKDASGISPETMLEEFTRDIKNSKEKIPARDPNNWRVAEANITKTDDYYLYQYYGVIFQMETKAHTNDPATQECPYNYDPYKHLDKDDFTDVPDHDVVAKDYVVYAVPVLYTLRVANDAPASVLSKIEKTMWEELPINVYEKLKAISGADIHLKAYVKDIDHGSSDSANIENDEYRERKNFSTKALLDEVKAATKNVSSTDTKDEGSEINQDYIKAKFSTTGYWNWICNDYDLHDITLLDSSALEKAYKEYDEAVKRYNALTEQLSAAENLKKLSDEISSKAGNVHNQYWSVYNKWVTDYNDWVTNGWNIWCNNVTTSYIDWLKAQGYRDYITGEGYSYYPALDERFGIDSEGWVDVGRDDAKNDALNYAGCPGEGCNLLSHVFHPARIEVWKGNNKESAKEAANNAFSTVSYYVKNETVAPDFAQYLRDDSSYQTYLSQYRQAVANYNAKRAEYINGPNGIYFKNHKTGTPLYDPANSSAKNITITGKSENNYHNGKPVDCIGNSDDSSWSSIVQNIANVAGEVSRVNELVEAAGTNVRNKHADYNTAYSTYVTARTKWETERNKYHKNSGNRDGINYNLTDPYDQAYWLSQAERGFDTYWYQYTGGINGTKAVKDTNKDDRVIKNCITFHTTTFVNIKDPFDDSHDESEDFYWVGQNLSNEIERYVYYKHRYNVRWKNDDYSTNVKKTNGYAEFLTQVSAYGYDLTRGEAYTILREIQPVYLELLQTEFEQWLKDNNKGELKDLSQEDANRLFGEFAETSDRYKQAANDFNKSYGHLFVHTDEDIKGDIDQIINKYLQNALMVRIYGDKSVRISYQNGEDIAYDCAVWFYQNWKGRKSVSDNNADFKAHTDPARYWYYIIKSRGWASYADGETSDTRPMYNDTTREIAIKSYLSGYDSTLLYPVVFGFNDDDPETDKKVDGMIYSDTAGSTSYKISLLQTATDKIYDMYNRKTCGLAELDVSSPAALAVSMAYPYGEENYTINDVVDYYELKKGSETYDIYPAVRCTETYVGVVNTIIAVDNAKTEKKNSTELNVISNNETVDSNIFSYLAYHVDLNINKTNANGELLNYSDPGTAIYATYVGSGASPELPYSFENQKRYLRFRNDFSMEQAAEALTAVVIDTIGLSDDVVKDLSNYPGTDQKGCSAYSRSSWYLAGEITGESDSETEYPYDMSDNRKRKYPLYGYYKAVSQSYNRWMNDIKPGDLIMTDSNAYIFVGDEAYDKFSDYMSRVEAHTAVCTAWKSDDPTCTAYNKDTGGYGTDPLRASGITVCTYNDLIDRGIYDSHSKPDYANVTKVATGFLSTLANKNAAKNTNTLKLIYEYHKSRGEKVFIYRCMNYDYELSWPRNTLDSLDFSSYNNGSKSAIVKYDGMQQYPLYEATGKETLGHIYEISPLPQDDLDGKSKAIAAVIASQNGDSEETDDTGETTDEANADAERLKWFVDLEYAAAQYADYKGPLSYRVSIEAIPVDSSE